MTTIRSHRPTTARLARILLATVTLIATVATRPVGAADPAGGDTSWSVTDPASEGVAGSSLADARDYAFTPDKHTQGLVVVRGGRIVDEWYAPGEGPRSWAASWSMAKSITSILIGIAIDRHEIAGVDEPMTTWFPEWAGTPKASMTLRNVLQMESGLKWNEGYDPADIANSDVIQMGLSADELAYAASRPLEVAPGTRFQYSSGDAMLLSGVLQRATGMPADAYAKQMLFGPLGISQLEWWRDAAGHTLTYCCVDTTSRNFARIGLLYLHDGNWNGRQIVSASWVHDSLQGTPESDGQYGYQWWLASLPGVDGPIAMMNGHDGQFTYVIPSLDMVVVRNGDYIKSACPPVADPNLFGRYPPNGLSPDAGTRPPESWSHASLLNPIIDAVTGPATSDVFPGVEPDPGTRAPDGQRMAPCADDTASTTTTTVVPQTTTTTPVPGPSTAAPVATAVAARPAYAG